MDDDPGRRMLLVADALGMATDLVLFTPSASGATAFDRLARRLGRVGPEQAAVLNALRRAQFRLLRVEAPSSDGMARLRDLVTDERLSVLDEGTDPGQPGWRSWPGSRLWATAATCGQASAHQRPPQRERWVVLNYKSLADFSNQ